MFSLHPGTWLVCIPVTFVTIHIFLEPFTDVRPHPRHLYYYIHAVRRRGSRAFKQCCIVPLPGRGWSRQSVTGDLRRRRQTDLEMQICPRASGKGKEPTPMFCFWGREKRPLPTHLPVKHRKANWLPRKRDRKWKIVWRTDERVSGAR